MVEPYVTRAELAAHYSVSVRTVDKWRFRGMPFVRWGSHGVRFKLSDAEGWLHGDR